MMASLYHSASLSSAAAAASSVSMSDIRFIGAGERAGAGLWYWWDRGARAEPPAVSVSLFTMVPSAWIGPISLARKEMLGTYIESASLSLVPGGTVCQANALATSILFPNQ